MHSWGSPVFNMDRTGSLGIGPMVRLTPKEVPTVAEIKAEMLAKQAMKKFLADNPPNEEEY
jgi:hypothetical protein